MKKTKIAKLLELNLKQFLNEREHKVQQLKSVPKKQ